MPTGVSRELVQQYFQACLSREPARLASILHDDVQWSCGGPVDLLPYCGYRRGKNTVIDTIVHLAPTAIRLTRMEVEEIVIEGERAATFSRLSGIRAGTGRTVSFRCAQYLRFQDGKLIEFRAVIDSFDAAEQLLGHPIDVVTSNAAHAKGVVAI